MACRPATPSHVCTSNSRTLSDDRRGKLKDFLRNEMTSRSRFLNRLSNSDTDAQARSNILDWKYKINPYHIFLSYWNINCSELPNWKTWCQEILFIFTAYAKEVRVLQETQYSSFSKFRIMMRNEIFEISNSMPY